MADIIGWLESAEGEQWSRAYHQRVYQLMSVKEDGPPFQRFLWLA